MQLPGDTSFGFRRGEVSQLPIFGQDLVTVDLQTVVVDSFLTVKAPTGCLWIMVFSSGRAASHFARPFV